MIAEPTRTILDYSPEYRSSIRGILTKIGWAEQYISAMEAAADTFSTQKENYGAYLAVSNGNAVGYLYVQYYAWNQLCQIQGLAVSPEFQRRGICPFETGARTLCGHSYNEHGRAKILRSAWVSTRLQHAALLRRWIGWGDVSKIFQ